MTPTEGSSDRWPPHFPSDKQTMPELGRERASSSFSLHLGKRADSAPVTPQVCGPAIKEGRASILRSNSPKIGAEMDVDLKLPTHDRSASATSKTFSMNARTLSSLSESSLALPSSRNASTKPKPRTITKPRLKSPNLFQRLSRLILSPLPSPNDQSPPSPPDSDASKKRRQAALRARGLLPPASPTTLELEQRRRSGAGTPVTDQDGQGSRLREVTTQTMAAHARSMSHEHQKECKSPGSIQSGIQESRPPSWVSLDMSQADDDKKALHSPIKPHSASSGTNDDNPNRRPYAVSGSGPIVQDLTVLEARATQSQPASPVTLNFLGETISAPTPSPTVRLVTGAYEPSSESLEDDEEGSEHALPENPAEGTEWLAPSWLVAIKTVSEQSDEVQLASGSGHHAASLSHDSYNSARTDSPSVYENTEENTVDLSQLTPQTTPSITSASPAYVVFPLSDPGALPSPRRSPISVPPLPLSIMIPRGSAYDRPPIAWPDHAFPRMPRLSLIDNSRSTPPPSRASTPLPEGTTAIPQISHPMTRSMPDLSWPPTMSPSDEDPSNASGGLSPGQRPFGMYMRVPGLDMTSIPEIHESPVEGVSAAGELASEMERSDGASGKDAKQHPKAKGSPEPEGEAKPLGNIFHRFRRRSVALVALSSPTLSEPPPSDPPQSPKPSMTKRASSSWMNLRMAMAATSRLRPKSAHSYPPTVNHSSEEEGSSSPSSPARTVLSSDTPSVLSCSTTLDGWWSSPSSCPGQPVRTPLNPPIYDRETLLSRTMAIQDDESRRLTSLAYLH